MKHCVVRTVFPACWSRFTARCKCCSYPSIPQIRSSDDDFFFFFNQIKYGDRITQPKELASQLYFSFFTPALPYFFHVFFVFPLKTPQTNQQELQPRFPSRLRKAPPRRSSSNVSIESEPVPIPGSTQPERDTGLEEVGQGRHNLLCVPQQTGSVNRAFHLRSFGRVCFPLFCSMLSLSSPSKTQGSVETTKQYYYTQGESLRRVVSLNSQH